MTIQAASIAMSSGYASTATHIVQESLRMGTGGARPDDRQGDTVLVSPGARILLQAGQELELDVPALSDVKLEIARMLLERLTGIQIQLLTPEAIAAEPTAPGAVAPAGGEPWVDYQRYELRALSETVSFSAGGTIRTADGAEISFAIAFQLQRSEVHESFTRMRLGGDTAVIDPLVVNFGGPVADLTGGPFLFDLTADGDLERIPFVGPGSGFLALDLEDQGQIHDGSQLFGPATGDGFAELAAHDADGNGWIDSSDPIYQHLRIWTGDARGNQLLKTLEQAGIEAIYLGRVSTPFQLAPPGPEAAGVQLQATGLYLRDGGTVGTVQQVDMLL